LDELRKQNAYRRLRLRALHQMVRDARDGPVRLECTCEPCVQLFLRGGIEPFAQYFAPARVAHAIALALDFEDLGADQLIERAKGAELDRDAAVSST